MRQKTSRIKGSALSCPAQSFAVGCHIPRDLLAFVQPQGMPRVPAVSAECPVSRRWRHDSVGNGRPLFSQLRTQVQVLRALPACLLPCLHRRCRSERMQETSRLNKALTHPFSAGGGGHRIRTGVHSVITASHQTR